MNNNQLIKLAQEVVAKLNVEMKNDPNGPGVEECMTDIEQISDLLERRIDLKPSWNDGL